MKNVTKLHAIKVKNRIMVNMIYNDIILVM